MSRVTMTPNMEPMMSPAVQDIENSGNNRRLWVATAMLSSLAVLAPSGIADAHEGHDNTPVAASTSSDAPTYEYVGACNYPGEFGKPDAADKLAAKNCLKYGLLGAEVVIIDLTEAPMSKLKRAADELEGLAKKETYGILTLDTKIIQPSAAAEEAVDEFISTGCMDPIEAAGTDTPLVVDIAVSEMPELNSVANVIAVTDAEPCGDILGYSNTKSRIDSFNARLQEISSKTLSRVWLHEISHNLGEMHEQTASNTAIISAKRPIESKYFQDGEFKFEEYLVKEATYGAVLNGGDTLMGAINPAVKRQPMNGFQLHRLDWARRILKKPGAFKIPTLKANTPYSFNSKSNRPQSAIISLGEFKNVKDYKLDKENQMNRVDEEAIAWDALTVEPMYRKSKFGRKTVEGVRIALGNTMDASEAVMGMLPRDKSQKKTIVRVPLPDNELVYGEVSRIAIITMKKTKVSVVIESTPKNK